MAIESWNTYPSHGVSIALHEFEEETTKYYQPELIIFLEPPTVGGEEEKVVCIMTDVYMEDKGAAIRMAATGVVHMFDELSDAVLVFNEEGEEIETLSINDYMEEGV